MCAESDELIDLGIMDWEENNSNQVINVLIVEDHEITRVGLKLTLSQMPLLKVIGEAEDGQSAISRALELKPNVILMDIGLPSMDGIEATLTIKTQMPDMRIVMLTSHDNDRDIFAALAAGADGYCLKEVSGTQLSLAIRTVADGAAWLDPAIASRVLKASAQTGQIHTSENLIPITQSSSIGRLSQREMEVLALVVEGLSNQEIANRLGLSVETIKTHMRHIMEKLAVSDRTQAAVKAMRQGLV